MARLVCAVVAVSEQLFVLQSELTIVGRVAGVDHVKHGARQLHF